MVIFHSFLYVYQRVSPAIWSASPPKYFRAPRSALLEGHEGQKFLRTHLKKGAKKNGEFDASKQGKHLNRWMVIDY
jgi:hypothetical protein